MKFDELNTLKSIIKAFEVLILQTFNFIKREGLKPKL